MIFEVMGMSLRRVWHLCDLSCVYVLFRLTSFTRYVFKSLCIFLRETIYEIFREHVAYLHSMSVKNKTFKIPNAQKIET